ncbi:MAG: hypothetical protein MMC23_008384 [Stictis urceolatum]|nr:hypothetical protein [Stictis urceolata]
MLNSYSLASLAGAILLPSVAASPENDLTTATVSSISIPTVTTTIPYLGIPTVSTTLDICFGTVTIVVETPLFGAACATTTPSLPSPTDGGPCVANPLCPASGYNVDYYPNRIGGYSAKRGEESNYYIVEDLAPLDSSLTNVTFFPQNYAVTGTTGPPLAPNASYPAELYYPGWVRDTSGGITVDANNFTMVYSGLYRAPATGAFQLCTSSDNENDVYFGHENAYSCKTGRPSNKADPLVMSQGGSFMNGIYCATVQLDKGLYYPIRSVMGNYQGPSAFNLTVVPSGTAIEDGSNDFTGFAYPHSCGIFL